MMITSRLFKQARIGASQWQWRRTISLKKSSGKFSCTFLSVTGHTEKHVYSFQDLYHKGLLARDLFALNLFDENVARDYSKPRKHPKNRVPYIFAPRHDYFIVSLGNVKSIVYKDHVLIFNPTKPVVKAWADSLSDIVPKCMVENPHNPFEFVVLESILQELAEMFDRRLRVYNPLVNNLLNNVKSEVDAMEGIQKMVPLEDGLHAFEIEVRESRQRLLDLLGTEEDMMGLLLTNRSSVENAKPEFRSAIQNRDRVSAELLLEGYAARLSHALNEIIFMQQKMQSRANMANMILMTQRNRIMRMNLHSSIAAVSIGTASCIAGIFGMNLTSGLEEQRGVFLAVVGGMIATVFTVQLGMAWKMFGWGEDARMIHEEAEKVEVMKNLFNDIGNIDHAIKIAFDSIDGKSDSSVFPADLLDGDSNSRISKSEFRKLLLHSRGYIANTRNEADTVDQHYKEVSKEIDQTVDSEVDAFFKLLDKDEDGFLDRTEFTKKE